MPTLYSGRTRKEGALAIIRESSSDEYDYCVKPQQFEESHADSKEKAVPRVRFQIGSSCWVYIRDETIYVLGYEPTFMGEIQKIGVNGLRDVVNHQEMCVKATYTIKTLACTS